MTRDRVLLTGGTGFLGSRVRILLERRGHEVLLADIEPGWRVPAPDPDQLVGHRPWWTRRGAERVAQRAGDVDHLVHLGYVVAAGDPVQRFLGEAEVNLAASLRLVDAVRPRHVVLASTARVYGAAARAPFREDAPAGAVEPYGLMKWTLEQSLTGWAQADDAAFTALRLSTLYGEQELVGRAIPNFIRAALAGQPAVIRGPGLELSDYLHVDDAAAAVADALVAPAQTRTLNVGSGFGRSTVAIHETIATLVAALTGAARVPVRHEPGPQRADVVLDTSAARTMLGWTPAVELEKGLRGEIEWFRGHPAGWREPSSAARGV